MVVFIVNLKKNIFVHYTVYNDTSKNIFSFVVVNMFIAGKIRSSLWPFGWETGRQVTLAGLKDSTAACLSGTSN